MRCPPPPPPLCRCSSLTARLENVRERAPNSEAVSGLAVKRLLSAARRDAGADIVVFARTDARQAVSLEEALCRANAFAEAGADVLFIDALSSVEEMAVFGSLGGAASRVPKVILLPSRPPPPDNINYEQQHDNDDQNDDHENSSIDGKNVIGDDNNSTPITITDIVAIFVTIIASVI